MKTAYLFGLIRLLTVALLLLLLGSCEQGTQPDTATIKIKLPKEFLASNNSGSVQAASVSGKPANISRIIIKVTSGASELGSADILKAGGTLTFEVPALTKLTVSGFAYANQTLRFRGSTSIGPLQPGSQNPVRLTLNPIGGVGGTIVIDGIVSASGIVSLFEVDNAGNTVGPARATATVVNGQFELEIPQAIIPSSRYIFRSDFNNMTVEGRFTDSGSIEVSAVTHAASLLVSELAGLALNGLDDISVQEIKEIQRTLQDIKNLNEPFIPDGEISMDDYARGLINTLKSDIQTTSVAASSIAGNEIRGQVLDINNTPVEGIDIVAHDFATTMLMARTTTDNNGQYRLNVPAQDQSVPFTQFQTSGEYILGAINRSRSTNNAAYASSWWTQNGGAVSRVAAGKLTFDEVSEINADFTLPPGVRIQGVVTGTETGAGSEPLPGITVIVRDKTTLYLVAAVTTDATGSYSLSVPAGQYIIEARNNTHLAYASETYSGNGGTDNLNTAEVVTLIENDVFTANFNMQAGIELRGTIESPSGIPVVGNTVFIDNDEGGGATRLRVTKSDGSYRVWLRPNVYEVFAYGHSQSVDLTQGLLQDPIVFNNSVAELPIAVHNGSGVSKVKARLFFNNDGVFEFKSVDFSKADGTLTLYSDTSGSHVVVAQVEGQEPYASTVYMGQTQRNSGTSIPLTIGQIESQLTVNAPDAGWLKGVVTSDGTTLIANVGVVVRQGGINETNFFVSTRTRSDGSYELSLPGGTYDAVRFVSSDNTFTAFNCEMILVNTESTTQLDVNTSMEPPCIGDGNPVENVQPVANAGGDRSVSVNTTVNLDGSNSSDSDGDELTYSWSILSSPPGSESALTNPDTISPSFIPDQIGDYMVQLIVHDGQLDSTPVTVTISAVNDPPMADAGPDQTVTVLRSVTLDGSASSDVNGDSLTYNWSFVSTPAESSATLSDTTIDNPTFTPDLLGEYQVQLIVSDGTIDSEPSTVVITAEPATVSLQLIDTVLVGVDRSAQLSVTLTDPAPAGGVSVTVSSDNSGILSLGQVDTVAIPAGETNGQLTVYGIAPGATTLRANANGYVEGTLDVSVTLNLISIPTATNVPLGQTTDVAVTIAPDVAPVGGVVVQISSSDPTIGELVTSTVTIAEGLRSANARIRGLRPGTVSINASNPNYASDSGEASVTAALNITQASLTFYQDFPQEVPIQLQSAGTNTAAPQPIAVTIISTDPSCVAVTSPLTIDTGFVETTTTVSYGGSADLPCTASITASAPDITPDTMDITVNARFTLQFIYSSETVGAGLQTYNNGSRYVRLGASNHGGVTIRIQSENPSLALVSPNATTAGSAFIDVFVPDGQQVARYVAHGVASGTTEFTATGTGFNNGTSSVSIVQPALLVTGLNANTTAFSANDPFLVYVGLPSATNASLSEYQSVRIGGGPLTATITSNNTEAGQLVTTAASGSPVSVEIAPGSFSSPNTVDSGGVAFDPTGTGTATIGASISGFIATDAAVVDVIVTQPQLQFYYSTTTVGAGLQTNYNTYRYVNLGATDHGGVTVRIQSDNPQFALVSPDANTAGEAFIDVLVPQGQQFARYVTQGIATGNTTFTASAPGFADGSATVEVVQPALMILGINPNTTTLSVDDPFQVYLGVPLANNSSLADYQSVRVGGGPLTATITSSNTAVGQLVTTAASAGLVTIDIAPGSYFSPNTVANGGVAFQPTGGGTVNISASITDFIATAAASTDVTVTAPQLQFFYSTSTVGAGLQTTYNSYRYVNLGATDHGGVTVRIESGDPQWALVSPDVNTPGTAFIDVTVPDGQQFARYVTHGVEAAAGSATFTASAPGFTDGSATVEVVQPAVTIVGLINTTTTLSTNSPFRVGVGIPSTNNASIAEYQAVRAGANPLTVTVSSEIPTFGRLVTSGATSGSVTVNIDPGQFYSASTVADGGVEFDPLTSGTTNVSADIQGFIQTTQASVAVTVEAPQLSFYYSNLIVGAGLQSAGSYRYVDLGATDHGGVSVRISSSNPSVALVAPNSVTEGADFIDVPVPDGQRYAYYVAQGVQPDSRAVTFSASAAGFAPGTSTVTVVTPALQIINLSTTTTQNAADLPFRIAVGIPSTNNTSISEYQSVHPGNSPLTATITSSAPSIGQLVTAGTSGGSVTVDIVAGQNYSPSNVASGGVAFDPLVSGTTTVSAAIPNFIATTQASVEVTVAP